MRRWLIAAGFAAALGSLGGCKESLGNSCRIDADCDGELVCNQAQLVCALPGASGGIDAELPKAPIDAPADATVDGPPDAK